MDYNSILVKLDSKQRFRKRGKLVMLTFKKDNTPEYFWVVETNFNTIFKLKSSK